jgi:hypothetical protein
VLLDGFYNHAAGQQHKVKGRGVQEKGRLSLSAVRGGQGGLMMVVGTLLLV